MGFPSRLRTCHIHFARRWTIATSNTFDSWCPGSDDRMISRQALPRVPDDQTDAGKRNSDALLTFALRTGSKSAANVKSAAAAALLVAQFILCMKRECEGSIETRKNLTSSQISQLPYGLFVPINNL